MGDGAHECDAEAHRGRIMKGIEAAMQKQFELDAQSGVDKLENEIRDAMDGRGCVIIYPFTIGTGSGAGTYYIEITNRVRLMKHHIVPFSPALLFGGDALMASGVVQKSIDVSFGWQEVFSLKERVEVYTFMLKEMEGTQDVH